MDAFKLPQPPEGSPLAQVLKTIALPPPEGSAAAIVSRAMEHAKQSQEAQRSVAPSYQPQTVQIDAVVNLELSDEARALPRQHLAEPEG